MALGVEKMAGRLPRFNPLELFKGALVQGQRQIGKAASDIRSVADELGTAGSRQRQPLQSPPSVPGPSKSKLPSEEPSETQEIATACLPCCLGHFSTSSGLLNECVRFKDDGITSNEILDRVAKVLAEQNALERVDLTPEMIAQSPEWEREMAERALKQSRSLRHKLENLQSMADIEQAAAETATFYRKLNREWFQKRLTRRADKAGVTVENVSEEPA